MSTKDEEFRKANEIYIVASLQAQALRRSIRTALISTGVEDTPETVFYLAKKMVQREGVSLLDEIEKLKGRPEGS